MTSSFPENVFKCSLGVHLEGPSVNGRQVRELGLASGCMDPMLSHVILSVCAFSVEIVVTINLILPTLLESAIEAFFNSGVVQASALQGLGFSFCHFIPLGRQDISFDGNFEDVSLSNHLKVFSDASQLTIPVALYNDRDLTHHTRSDGPMLLLLHSDPLVLHRLYRYSLRDRIFIFQC